MNETSKEVWRESEEIQISAAAAPDELFGALAAEIVKAHVTMTEETVGPSPVAELFGISAAVELCGRGRMFAGQVSRSEH